MLRLTREQLSAGHNVLMDWSSFLKLTEPQSVSTLRQELTYAGDAARFREMLDPFLIDIVQRLVVYDGFLLDTAAQETFRNPLSAEAVRIAPVAFEQEIYQDATRTTLESLRALEKIDADLTKKFDIDALFFADLKRYTDEIYRGFHTLGGSIADSNQSVPRAIFYLELSRHLGLQMFLSYEKRNLLRDLKKLLWQDAFTVVSKNIDSVMKKSARFADETSDLSVQTPPLIDLIIRRAFDRKISLEKSIIEVRNLEGAHQFRDLLAKVQQLLMIGDAAAALDVRKLLTPLLKAAETWSTAADPRVRWMWQAKVSKLPWVGAFLEALGIEAPALPIKFRNRSYIQFVSEWYNAESHKDGSNSAQEKTTNSN
jgi:hypothetical protein